MSSSPSKFLLAALAALVLMGLAGCIADTAADSDLPWATNHSWESLGPLPAQMIDRND